MTINNGKQLAFLGIGLSIILGIVGSPARAQGESTPPKFKVLEKSGTNKATIIYKGDLETGKTYYVGCPPKDDFDEDPKTPATSTEPKQLRDYSLGFGLSVSSMKSTISVDKGPSTSSPALTSVAVSGTFGFNF